MRDNKGRFSKGHIPWSKGKKGKPGLKGALNPMYGKTPVNKGKKYSGEIKQKMKDKWTTKRRLEMSLSKTAEKNPMWKGDSVDLEQLHVWVRKRKPKPLVCERCEEEEPYDLCNISPKYNRLTYTRNLNNWRWFCRRCHQRTDGRTDLLRNLWKRRIP